MKGLGCFFTIIALLCGAMAGIRASTGHAPQSLDGLLWIVAFILIIIGLICLAAGSGGSNPQPVTIVDRPHKPHTTKPQPPSQTLSYYLYLNDQVKGPFSLLQIQGFLQVDSATPSTPCCPEGSDQWITIRDII